MSNILVAYFSASGVTARAANALAEAADADLYEILPAVPYTDADLDWTNKKSRSSVEMNDPTARPALAGELPDLTWYDTIFLGFPIWWYTAPSIIKTFLEAGDFSGKKIALFATSGGSGLGHTDRDLQSVCPGAVIQNGKLLNGSQDVESLASWAKRT
ncbi:NAD(P)H-dependent oxidoreductase [Oscillibacter sp. MSJ-2]|uniref:NAD(P)H-dependent oxidoreductase n=1 Tax=Dysosmobacter acutus TaxID=2841504 RepID=A0ABS6F9B2_9FIRM|nr:flavodoxin [Dysosmobacter acutus]MBU5626122.1 NAD(P)H-dependent oxidoreductase [Dysosmobacter acutus]